MENKIYKICQECGCEVKRLSETNVSECGHINYDYEECNDCGDNH